MPAHQPSEVGILNPKRLFRGLKLLFGFDDGRSKRAERSKSKTATPETAAKREVPTKPENEPLGEQPRPERANERSGANLLQRTLQRELDKGVALERRVVNPLGALGASVLMGRRTTQADVDAWEARVERLLRDKPRWLSLFRYEEPSNPLEYLVPKPLESPLRRRLERRTAQLEKIIRSLR